MSMTKIEIRQHFLFRKRLRQQKKRGRQTIGGLQGPDVTNPTMSDLEHPSSASEDEDSEDMDFSAPRKSAAFTVNRSDLTVASEEHTLLQRSVAAGYEGRRSPTSGSTIWMRVREVSVQKRLGNRAWTRIRRVPSLRLLLGPTAGTRRDLQHRRSHARTLRMRSLRGVWIETCRPRHHCGTQRAHCFATQAADILHAVVCGTKLAAPGSAVEPRGLTASQSRPADLFTTAAVPGRSAALDVCVASPNATAARGDAAQAAFDRKLSNCRNEIPDLRNQGIHCRPLVWTGDHTLPSLKPCNTQTSLPVGMGS